MATVAKKIVQQSSKGNQIIADGSGHFVFEDKPDLELNQLKILYQEII